jgi:NAD(P)H dehydrogenase (quinone)
MVAQVTGKPVRFERIHEEQLCGGFAQAGLPEMYVGMMLDIERKFVRGGFDIVTGGVERLPGRRPQSLGDLSPCLLDAR